MVKVSWAISGSAALALPSLLETLPCFDVLSPIHDLIILLPWQLPSPLLPLVGPSLSPSIPLPCLVLFNSYVNSIPWLLPPWIREGRCFDCFVNYFTPVSRRVPWAWMFVCGRINTCDWWWQWWQCQWRHDEVCTYPRCCGHVRHCSSNTQFGRNKDVQWKVYKRAVIKSDFSSQYPLFITSSLTYRSWIHPRDLDNIQPKNQGTVRFYL